MTAAPRGRVNVLHYISNTGMTGVESYVLTVCENLARDGYRSTIACALEGREELSQRAAAHGVRVVPLDFGRRSGGALGRLTGFARKAVGQVAVLRRVMVDEQVDVLHVHTASAPVSFHLFAAALLARVRAVVVTHHALLAHFREYRNFSSNLGFWLEKRIAQRITAYYDGQAGELRGEGVRGESLRVVPHGVDTARYDGLERSGDGTRAEFRLAIVARLIEGKGHSELVRAIARLIGRHAGLRVDVIGDGPLRAALEKEIRALGLEREVRLLGTLPNAELPARLVDVDAIVLPSYMVGEVFPVSLLEGMALGLPAIGARFSGIPSIIADGETGYVVEPGDVASLADAIERLAADPAAAAAMGRRARERVRERFSASAQSRSLETIYEEALASTPPSVLRLVTHRARRTGSGVAAIAFAVGQLVDLADLVDALDLFDALP